MLAGRIEFQSDCAEAKSVCAPLGNCLVGAFGSVAGSSIELLAVRVVRLDECQDIGIALNEISRAAGGVSVESLNLISRERKT